VSVLLKALGYVKTAGDEVEDLTLLLQKVKAKYKRLPAPHAQSLYSYAHVCMIAAIVLSRRR